MSDRKVAISVVPETILDYKINDEYKGKLTIINEDSRICRTSEGLTLTIDKNEYVLVSDFIDYLTSIPKIDMADNLIYILKAGSHVKMENGITVALVTPLYVRLPPVFDIIIKKGAKLQQKNAAIHLTLEKDITYRIDTIKPEDKTTPTGVTNGETTKTNINDTNKTCNDNINQVENGITSKNRDRK